ncbi:MAG: hypothetical protein IH624_01430 [Phycisphaerae bacterium]|nr:hypothetical protein [Phycisphaerae bacterium]
MHDGKKHKKTDLDLVRRLPVPRGRIVVAVILVTTMAFMWARVLFSGKGGPAAASGAVLRDIATTAADAKARPRLTRIDLPVIEGRHDRLSRDFFATANGQAFQFLGRGPSNTPPADPVAQQDLTESDVRAIEQGIKLDGIIAEQNHNARQAFINGKLVSVGDDVKIEYKSRQFKLTVIEIHKSNVMLGLENYKLNVAMPQADNLNNW